MGHVVIMSGIPGCGKSTLAKQLVDIFHTEPREPGDAYHISADNFFTNPTTGEYAFNPARIAEAHAECFHSFMRAIQAKGSMIIVDNTNIHDWERYRYELFANMMGYGVSHHFFVAKTIEDVRRCIRRNVHGVPAEVICRMALEHQIEPVGPNIIHHHIK